MMGDSYTVNAVRSIDADCGGFVCSLDVDGWMDAPSGQSQSSQPMKGEQESTRLERVIAVRREPCAKLSARLESKKGARLCHVVGAAQLRRAKVHSDCLHVRVADEGGLAVWKRGAGPLRFGKTQSDLRWRGKNGKRTRREEG